MHWDPYEALYLHIPFCVSKCAYCDFASTAVARDDEVVDAYVDELILEIRRASRAGLLGRLRTVYLGGGTPSHIGSPRLSKLLYALSVSMHMTPDVEFTMEANPDSLDERLVKDIWALGVNRLSIGVQSFDDGVLRMLGRPHDASRAYQAVQAAQARFCNVSIDLMCGIPGQSEDSLMHDVLEAIRLDVAHVSIYPLTIEEGTRFCAMVERGALSEPDDDTAADHMQLAHELLVAAGYERYEVASYAKPGFQSRHNIAYWTGVPYLGLGRGAITMRQCSTRRERLRDGEVVESLDAASILSEDLMLRMRMSQGLSKADIDEAALVYGGLPETIALLEERGLVAWEGGRCRPTQLGWLCGNELYAALMFLS